MTEDSLALLLLKILAFWAYQSQAKMYKINQAIAREYFFFKKKKKSRVLRAGQSNLVRIILLVVHVHFVMEEVLR